MKLLKLIASYLWLPVLLVLSAFLVFITDGWFFLILMSGVFLYVVCRVSASIWKCYTP